MPSYIAYTEAPHKNRNDWHSIRRLAPLLWEYKYRVIFALSTLLLSKFANVAIPLVLKAIVDGLDFETISQLPLILLLAYGALRLAAALFNELRDAIFARVRYHAIRRLSNQVLSHLHQLSLRFHLERQTGGISRDLERGTRSLSAIMNLMVFNILPTLVEFSLIALILFSQYEVSFALITFATVIIYISFTLTITEWRMHFRHRMNALDSQANTQAIDSIINYETVKYFGNETFELKRYDQTLQQWEDAAVSSQTSMSALNFGQSAIIAIGVTIIMIFAAQGVVNGHMTLGDLVLVNAYLLQLFIPLNFLGIVYRQIKYALADMDLVVKLLEQAPEITDKANATSLVIPQGEIEFKQIDFAYQPERPILQQLSFTIPAGKTVAVVGASGAGKSTLARLLYRFYDVNQGQIFIDKQDIATVSQASLRSHIGIVPQDTVLFNDTIYYNLQYACPSASKETVINAAKLAHIHEFITSLPKGYDSIVGERGLKLSGGEKQRIAIARAILKQPKILIFDEATSSLDSKTEQAIQQTLNDLAQHHTTLIIAHRLSTIINADWILVMDHGKIIEQGQHQTLLEQQGSYAHLWQLQQKDQD